MKLTGEKFAHALAEDLNVIYCVGEKLEEREQNKTESVVTKQMEIVIGKIFALHIFYTKSAV